MTSCADLAVVPLQASTRVAVHLLSGAARDPPRPLGSRSPVRLGIPGFLLSKVSQKITALPSCRPQFPLTGPGVGVDVGVGVGVDTDANAEQLALVPLLEPLQLHVHGPEPATDDAVPAEQR